MNRSIISVSLLLAFAVVVPSRAASQASPAPNTRDPMVDAIRGLKWRSVGPANNAGRVSVVHGVPGDPSTYYVAGANGGIIKTTNGGTTFKPVFDKQSVGSIGAIAIAPSDPNVIYVGTGEGNPRNNASIGDGMYKSVDAGEHWTKIGLEKTDKIARIIVDSRNPNLVYVCGLGREWGPNEDRGVFKTIDGGVTWKRVFPPFSRCAGGNAANNGDYERATDPWVSFSPNGVAHQMALSFDDAIVPGKPASAMLASRSTDGGRSWSRSIVLVADTEERFNDKNSMTADPLDARFVYATWDRLSFVAGEGAGPTLFARSTDNGLSWEQARIIFDPGLNAQTIGARIEVLPNGHLVNLFTLIDFITNDVSLHVILSSDKGVTWSAPTCRTD